MLESIRQELRRVGAEDMKVSMDEDFEPEAGPLLKVENGSAYWHNDLATMKAKCAVAEYLRDLGLRDPELVAKESQRIVGNAQRQLSLADANNESQLCERAVRLTVKQLELWLEVLAAQSGRPDHSQRLGSVIAARLPALLDRFPYALNGDELPAELVESLKTGVNPVVPTPRPGRMRRQMLPLIPSSLKRLGSQLRKLLASETSKQREKQA